MTDAPDLAATFVLGAAEISLRVSAVADEGHPTEWQCVIKPADCTVPIVCCVSDKPDTALAEAVAAWIGRNALHDLSEVLG